VADTAWLAPVAAAAANLLRDPAAADANAAADADADADNEDDDDDEDGDGSVDASVAALAAAHEEVDGETVALAKAVLAAARLPAQQVALASALAQYTAGKIQNAAGTGVSGCGGVEAEEHGDRALALGARGDLDEVDNEGRRTTMAEVKGATAMLQRLSRAGALPATAAAALRAARDAAVAQGDAWEACGVTSSLSALVIIMA
jgi:hypothetical protein